jgi:hypothetical protein
MGIDRIYCRVTPNSPAAEAVEKLDKQHRTAAEATIALFKELRIPKDFNPFECNGVVLGFASNPRQASIDWTKEHLDKYRLNRDRYTVPRRDTSEGKHISAKFRALPKFPNESETNKAFGLPAHIFVGMSVTWVSLVRPKGSDPIVGIPWTAWRDKRDNMPVGLEKLETEVALTIIEGDKKKKAS